MKSRNRLAYCSGWTVEISAPAWDKEGEKRAHQHPRTTGANIKRLQAQLTPPTLFLPLVFTHPVFDSFCCMSCFLLGVVLSQYVNQAHEVDLPLRGSWDEEQRTIRARMALGESRPPLKRSMKYFKLIRMCPTMQQVVPPLLHAIVIIASNVALLNKTQSEHQVGAAAASWDLSRPSQPESEVTRGQI